MIHQNKKEVVIKSNTNAFKDVKTMHRKDEDTFDGTKRETQLENQRGADNILSPWFSDDQIERKQEKVEKREDVVRAVRRIQKRKNTWDDQSRFILSIRVTFWR